MLSTATPIGEPAPSPPPKPSKPAHLKPKSVDTASTSPRVGNNDLAHKHIQRLETERSARPPELPAKVATNTTTTGTSKSQYTGSTTLVYTLWAHNLGYAAGLCNVVLGFIAVAWNQEIVDRPSAGDILFAMNFCGPYCVVIGLFILAWEKFCGLAQVPWLPAEEISGGRSWVRGTAYAVLSIGTLFSYATMVATGVMLICSGANFMAYQKKETLTPHNTVHESYFLCKCSSSGNTVRDEDSKSRNDSRLRSRCRTIWRHWEEAGVIGQVLLVFVYVGINVVLFAQRLNSWIDMVDELQRSCASNTPYNCLSDFAPYAKAFGQTLNFNCSVLLLPVLRTFVRKLNDLSVTGASAFAKYMPPLRKNVVLHKFIACFVLAGALGHILFHLLNLWKAPEATTARFQPGAFVSGFLITFAMVVIFAGAQNRVKRAKYETFWNTHHSFLLFYACLLAHAPKFWIWGFLPLLAYIGERVYRERKSRKVFYVASVVYKEPVMCLSFFPARSGDFVFKEGQYLHLLAPAISGFEWHPFTISSAYEDLEKKNGQVTLHIRVQGQGSWTWRLCQRFKLMAPQTTCKGDNFSLYLSHLDSQGNPQRGKFLGPDGLPLIQVDGPHAAPAQHYDEYNNVMLVGAGIGLTPSSAIIQSVLRHKWKKGFHPSTIHFHFVVRHSEIFSFRWFINLLHELQRSVASDYAAGALDKTMHRLQIHLFVTRAPKDGKHVDREQSFRVSNGSVHPSGPRDSSPCRSSLLDKPVEDPNLRQAGMNVNIGFLPEDLELSLLNPSVSSKNWATLVQESDTAESAPVNKYQDIWIWNGRPPWDDIFAYVKQHRQPETERVGVCFCGTPIIGKDLKSFCQKYSSVPDKCHFELHKENF